MAIENGGAKWRKQGIGYIAHDAIKNIGGGYYLVPVALDERNAIVKAHESKLPDNLSGFCVFAGQVTGGGVQIDSRQASFIDVVENIKDEAAMIRAYKRLAQDQIAYWKDEDLKCQNRLTDLGRKNVLD